MSGWRLALRVARREAWRNKKRSALVVAMLALPVAGGSAADTLWRSSQITPEQRAVWQMGGYDALVTDVGTPMYQTPDAEQAGPVRQADGATPEPLRMTAASAADLARLLPAGSQVSKPESLNGPQLQIVDDSGRAWGRLNDTDLTDPLLAGTVDHVTGTAPVADDEVALSSSLAGQLDKKPGDTVEVRPSFSFATHTPPAPKTLRVTGVYDTKLRPYDDLVFARPGVLSSLETAGQTAFAVTVPGGVDWNLAQRLNAQGFTVQSKLLSADPPARSRVPYYQAYPDRGSGGDNSETLAVAVIGLSIVLLEVVLLAGPAFAVSARRRRRDFGLLGAAGADSRRLRRIVLADGVVLGAAGGVIGVAAGIAGAAAVLPWFGHFTQQSMGGFRLKPLELLAAAVVGVGTGVAAAVAPAIATARQDVMVALTGRRGQSATPWKLPLAGLVGALLGSALIVFGAWHHGNALVVAAGVVVAELGLVACTPALVAWSGKLARALPLTGRLALRDTARNRGRTAPAVAAIMAAVAGATTVAMVISSDDAQQRRYYQSQLRPGQAVASFEDGSGGVTPAVADRLMAQIGTVLSVSRSAVLQGVSFGDGQVQPAAPEVIRTPENMCPSKLDGAASAKDPRCDSRGGAIQFMTGATDVVVGGPDLLRILIGHEDPAAEATLKGGGAVVFDKYHLAGAGPNPTVAIGLPSGCDRQKQPSCPAYTVKTTLPAALVDSPRTDIAALVAPGALDRLGAKFAPMAVLFDTAHMPSGQEEKQADDLVAAAGVQQRFYVERGYQSQTWVGLLALAAVAGVVMLGAAAVATGLAITDAQADLETLAAVGARPRLRRLLAGSQAAVTAGLGAVLGVAFGLLPAVGVIEAKAQQIASDPYNMLNAQQTQFAPPWLYLGSVVVALPVLAAAGAAGFTRSRIEMRRRRG